MLTDYNQKLKTLKTYKIYCLAHPITNEIRYIGITSSSLSSRLGNHIRQSRVKEDKSYRANWIRKLISNNLKPNIILIEETIDKHREIEIIEEYKEKGYRLINATSGGDGVHDIPLESRKRISDALKHRKISDETREKLSKAKKNRVVSDETREKLSKFFKGRKIGPPRPETIEKMREAKIGHIVSEETRNKISKTLTGRIGKKKQFCKYGHEYTPENTYQITSTRRDCKLCIRRRSYESYIRKKNI